MRAKRILLSMVCVGLLASCSDVSTRGEIEPLNKVADMEQHCNGMDSNDTNSSCGEGNVTAESKALKAELEKLENKQKRLEILSSLDENSFKSSHKTLLEELQKIKWEREVLTEEFELQKIKDERHNYEETQKQQKELDAWTHKASIAEAKARELETETMLKKTALLSEQNRLESEIALLKVKKEREAYLSPEDAYLNNPLSDDNKTLIISDRRIDLNGLITYDMAESIANQINYLNNKDSKMPIFIVIDSSPGGSIMAGNIIIQSMESSNAPIYVVLKSFAASMAAVIVTLAENSFAYPHAVMMHHQPMLYSRGMSNLTEEREKYQELENVWRTFGKPIATKMGIDSTEFVKLMYKHSSSGNWREYATKAVELKWVNNVVMRIEDKSILVDPLLKEDEKEGIFSSLFAKEVEKDGEVFVYLPRLRPTDAYFIYNPDGYYRDR